MKRKAARAGTLGIHSPVGCGARWGPSSPKVVADAGGGDGRPFARRHRNNWRMGVGARRMQPAPSAANRGRDSPSWKWRLREAYLPENRPKGDDEWYDQTQDIHYRQIDFSEKFALEARGELVRNLAKGPATVDLADAAFQIAAEDDAIVSHSTVKLPVRSFKQRIDRLVSDLLQRHLTGGARPPEEVLQVLGQFLFEEQRFRLPTRSGTWQSEMPQQAVVDNPGVWEDARHAYLNELLITKVGTPSALAVLYTAMTQQLLQRGVLECAVRVECGVFDRRPTATVLRGMPRSMVVQSDGSVLNTCSLESLEQMLQHLKRAFWPFPWDSSIDNTQQGGCTSGGFRAAVKIAVDGQDDAALRAIARTARHRQERGVWTSLGGGDIRRAVAACERLVLLSDPDSMAWPRRDLAVALLHAGQIHRAHVEMEAFLGQQAALERRGGTAQEARDSVLSARLMERLREVVGEDTQLLESAQPITMQGEAERTKQTLDATYVMKPITW